MKLTKAERLLRKFRPKVVVPKLAPVNRIVSSAPGVKQQNGTFIYFFGVRDYNHPEARIKIGHSDDVKYRRQTFGGDLPPEEYHLYAAIKGTKEDEDYVLRYFKDLCVHGEYFFPNEPLLGYIRWLRQLPCTALDFDSLSSVPIRYFSEWMPELGRTCALEASLILPDSWDDIFPLPEIRGDDFYTDVALTDAARVVMGSIDLDPASDMRANKDIQAARFYAKGDLNGLNQPWYGNVWLNPPFSEWEQWAEKANAELDRGGITQMCLYTGANTMGNKYMARLKSRSDRHVLGDGRWKHWGPKSWTGSPFVSYVFYYGPNTEKFEEVFSQYGHVWTLARDLRLKDQDLT